MTNTKPQTASDIKAEMERLQAAYAEAQAAETAQAQAERFTAIAEHLQLVNQAVEAQDITAVRTTVSDLAAFTKSAFGSPRKASTGNGNGERVTHEGKLADLIPTWLKANPGDHTPTEIGHGLGRSSGAVSAAITRDKTGLLATGAVTQTSTKPQRFAAV